MSKGRWKKQKKIHLDALISPSTKTILDRVKKNAEKKGFRTSYGQIIEHCILQQYQDPRIELRDQIKKLASEQGHIIEQISNLKAELEELDKEAEHEALQRMQEQPRSIPERTTAMRAALE